MAAAIVTEVAGTLAMKLGAHHGYLTIGLSTMYVMLVLSYTCDEAQSTWIFSSEKVAGRKECVRLIRFFSWVNL